MKGKAIKRIFAPVAIVALLFTGSAPVSPYTMGDANPNHELVGPFPCPMIMPGVCATPEQIATEP